MVVQTRRSQAILLILSVVFCLALGSIGYIYIGNSPGFAWSEAKKYSEIVLFLSIIFSILLAAVSAAVFLRNKNILKELDKVVEMSLYSNFSPVESLRKLSLIGEKIEHIYRNVSTVNEKRLLKISAMHNLNGFLLENLSLPVIVTDVRGVIVSVSRQARDRAGDRQISPGEYITNVYTELNFQDVLETLNHGRSFTEARAEKEDFRFYPVRNRESNIAYIVSVLGGARVYTMDQAVPKPQQPKKKKVKYGLLSRLRGRKGL